MTNSPEILWQPSKERVARSNISAFIKLVNKRWQAGVKDSQALYEWSVSQPEQFWTSVWDFGGVIAETRGERVLADARQDARRVVVPRCQTEFRREPAAQARRQPTQWCSGARTRCVAA